MSNTNGQSVKTIMAWFWARQVSKDLRNEHTTNLKIDFRRLLTLIGMIPRKRGHVRTILRLENVTPIVVTVANYRAYSRGSARNGRNLSNRTSVVERNDARKWRPFRRERKGGVLGSRDLPERGDK